MILKKTSIVLLLTILTFLNVSCSGGSSSPLLPEKTSINSSWLLTWGDLYSDSIRAQAISPDGGIIISTFQNWVVYPTPEGYVPGNSTNNLLKFDSSGEPVWSHIYKNENSYIDTYGIVCDADGNIFTCGRFRGNINFAPISGKVERVSNGGYDAFISKFGSQGNHLWTTTWGSASSTKTDGCYSITLDQSGNVIVKSEGIKPEEKISNAAPEGQMAVISRQYLSKFDQNGNLLWTIDIVPYSKSVTTDKENCIYIVGSFSGIYGFNKGSGVDEITSNGSNDIYITKFDENGVYLWTKTWGREWSEKLTGVFHSSSNMLICAGVIGITELVESGKPDHEFLSFLSTFDLEGELLWSKTWEADAFDYQVSTTSNNQTGEIYVISEFAGTVDFDPGPGEDFHTNNGDYRGSYISVFDQNGNFFGTQTMGTTGYIASQLINMDNSSRIYISGGFFGDTEFTFGGSNVRRKSNGYDLFLMRISPDDLLITD